jgi:prepilin peptidase CpaA
MELFSLDKWPLLLVCSAMIASAVIDWWKFKVPNLLTFPLIISGWLFALCHNFGWFPGTGDGGIGASLAGTFFAMALLLPVYAIGGMGAGDVKMTMGFGSWIGAFYGFQGDALWIIFWAFCTGVIIGGVIALGMIIVRGQYRQNLLHTREIVGDLFSSSSITDIADRANKRRSRWHRLPYGIPLCIGFVGYLFFRGGI